MLSSSSSSPKICFNSLCKHTKSEQWRKGWRLRNGDFAQLCDRCSSAFEELKFCEIFHSDAAGWRNCESCGKRIHCGCIASANIFLHLDAGGIECYPCAKKNFYMASNQMFPSLFLPKNLPEKLKDDSVRPTSIPEHWRQPKAITNNANGQSELHRWMSYKAETPNTVDNLILGSSPSASAHENKKIEEPSERIKLEALDGFTNDSKKVVAAESGLMTNSIDGINVETHRSSFANISQQPSAPYNDPSARLFGLSDSFSSPNERIDPSRVRGALPHHQAPPPQLAKRLYSSPNKGIDSSGEQNQFHGGRLRAEARGRNQLLPRYWPRITDLELQQISGDSNSTITPLFEKILSASDAGRVGRLVLPKKCAEAYFPTISQPEGQPLKVQDVRGKEWVFQFRFWPNNNSRMYVLEGVTPCIQSMQLQAGDTVTFSRMEPEGKLVMGFRKASSIPSEQDIHARKTGNDISTTGHVNNRISKASDIPSSFPLRPSKGGVESNSNSPMNQADPIDPANTLATLDPVSVPKETGPNCLPNKRKKSTLLLKSKRLRIDNDDSMVLKLTWEEAQFLLRPPKVEPSIVIIEGHDFEEYEEAPILGKPTFFTTSTAGEKIQWAQCEHCSKWRKLPGDALMPAHWNCYLNCSWDHERATCEAPQELTTEQLEALISSKIATSKRKKVKKETDTAETSEGLDTLAHVAIFGEGGSLDSSTQATTKHPRHRPGCSCIVCIQPPSGKGPKHKQTCTCNVCLTVRRRFQTLMLRRERRQAEKESESPRKKQKIKLLARKKELRVEQLNNDNNGNRSNNGTLNQIFVKTEEDCDDGFRRESSCLFKGRIDLNIQPEREEELSPISDSISTIRFLQDATDLYSRDQNVDGNMDTNTNQMKLGVNVKAEDPSRGDPPLDPDGDNPPLICASLSTSSPANS